MAETVSRDCKKCRYSIAKCSPMYSNGKYAHDDTLQIILVIKLHSNLMQLYTIGKGYMV